MFIPTSSTCSEDSMGDSSKGSGQQHCCDNPQLEELAVAFANELRQRNLVQDHSSALRKTVAKAFSGKDAVTVLHELLMQQDSDSPSRKDALAKGQSMMEEFALFQHASQAKKGLVDSAGDFYQFENNLPCQVRRVKDQHKTHWDKMRLIEAHVDCQDRKTVLKVLPDCFVANEAVDVLMEIRLVKSRREAVHLLNRLNDKLIFFKHVTSKGEKVDLELKDEYTYFQFVPMEQRRQQPGKRLPSPKRGTSPMRSGEKSGGSSPCRSRARDLKREASIRATNHKRAQDIKNRLANHKEEVMRQARVAANAGS